MPAHSNGDATVEAEIGPAIQRIGRYEVRSVLGRGAMGIVYRAYDSVLERTVALKTHHACFSEDDALSRRFAAEIKTSSRLNHPGIVTIYDGGIETDVPFIAMELIEGKTLQAILAERGRLPPDEALAILGPVGEALAYAHRQQIVHRDVKPANILIQPNGQPKVSDFGVAKALGSSAATTTIVAGTPSHMAPEQVSGAAIDARVDVFALGVVAYEMLTGRAPFEGSELVQVALAVVSLEPPAPSDVEPSLPKAVDTVIARALAKDPARRYPDTDVFVEDLRAALSPGRFGEATDAARAVGVRTPTKHRAVAMPAGVALVVAIGAGAWAMWSRPAFSPFPAPGSSVEVAAASASGPEPPTNSVPTPTAPGVGDRSVESSGAAPEPAAPKQAAEPPRRQNQPRHQRNAASPAKRVTLATIGRRVSPAASSLEVISQPRGAAVVVDGKARGRAPVRIDGLARGTYEVTIAFPGVAPQTRAVSVAGGGSRHTVTFQLSSAP